MAHPLIPDLERRAQVLTTPHRDGHIVWRVWGNGPPLVLLHGGTGSWQHWVHNILALSQDFQLVLPDIPGQGRSDLLKNATMRDLADAMADGIDQVIGADPYLLGGFSFGGYLSAHILRRHHTQIRRLILIGSVGFGAMNNPADALVNWKACDPGDPRDQAHRTNLRVLLLANDENNTDLALAIQSYNSETARLRARNLYDNETVQQMLTRFPVPVSALWGDQDALTKGHLPTISSALRQADQNVDIKVLAGMGHWVQFEAPDAVNRFILLQSQRSA